MGICDECIIKDGCKFANSGLIMKHCKNFIGEAPHKIVTNFDRITASPEALAEFIIDKLQYCKRPVCPICPVWKKCDGVSKDAFAEWLNEESKE